MGRGELSPEEAAAVRLSSNEVIRRALASSAVDPEIETHIGKILKIEDATGNLRSVEFIEPVEPDGDETV